MAYVYFIEINNKKYIGSCIDYNARIKYHKKTLIDGVNASKKLQKAFNEFGDFKSQIIKEVSEKTMRSWESYYIGQYDTINNGYNTTVASFYSIKNDSNKKKEDKKLLYKIDEVLKLLKINKEQFNAFVSNGTIKTTKIFKLTLVHRREIERLMGK